MRVLLDLEGRHAVHCRPDGAGGAHMRLSHNRGDGESPLHLALRRVVGVAAGPDSHYRFSEAGDTVTVAHDGTIDVVLGSRVVAGFRRAGSEWHATTNYQLSSFECRYLAEYGRLYPIPTSQPPGTAPCTDLHTHYAGCVAGSDLVVLGCEHGATYTQDQLSAAGVHVAASGPVRLGDLSAPIRARIADQLEVPTQRRITFRDMERIYRLRAPLTKPASLFAHVLRRIAEDYARMGVTYVELSLGDVLWASRLRAVHACVPAIEAETGVTLRFLAAMSRHDDVEWDLDFIARLGDIVASRYVVGVDFMGHETNSTHAFARQIRDTAAWASRQRPGFVVRVHAGENPAHPENIRVAMDCVAGCDVQLRIGHGLYGADEPTLERMVNESVIVEFNLNSNFALNNIQSLGEAPLTRYLSRGVPVVLGSDGYGIYRASPALEVRAAWLRGVDASDIETIRATERAYVERRIERDAAVVEPAFRVPDDAPLVHFSDAVVQRKRRARRERDARLAAAITDAGAATVTRQELVDRFSARQCLSVAGAWRNSFANLGTDEQAAVRMLIRDLVDGLDPAHHVLLTGGTRYGVEAVVAEHAARRGVPHVAVLVASTPPDSLATGRVDLAVVVGDSLHDKAGALYELVRDVRGACLFVGGGNIVSDEIQCARNLRLRYLLCTAVPGASALHAQQEPHRGFATAAEGLRVLSVQAASHAPPAYHYVGVNPTADMIAARRCSRGGGLEILLVRRHVDAGAEPGAWALPGGFVASPAPPGGAWAPGGESARVAAVRELYEETGVDARALAESLAPVGTYEGGGRDPRDTHVAWSRSSAFALVLPSALAHAPVAGGDDAVDARWFSVASLPAQLAFDHQRIIDDWLEWYSSRP